jgi:hypothetical protein
VRGCQLHVAGNRRAVLGAGVRADRVCHHAAAESRGRGGGSELKRTALC